MTSLVEASWLGGSRLSGPLPGQAVPGGGIGETLPGEIPGLEALVLLVSKNIGPTATLRLNLRAAGINTVIWCTGFTLIFHGSKLR